jgi:hypothetical protein
MITVEETKDKAKKLAKKTAIILLISAIIFSIGYYFYRTYETSEGTRTGMLFKISKKGYVFKTYEGQLHLGGSQMMSQASIWDFSVKNETVYNQIQALEGKNVKLHYKQLINPFIWQGETEYIVYQADLVQ